MFYCLFFPFQKLEAFVDVKSQAEFLIKYGKTEQHSRKFRQYVSARRGCPEQPKVYWKQKWHQISFDNLEVTKMHFRVFLVCNN